MVGPKFLFSDSECLLVEQLGLAVVALQAFEPPYHVGAFSNRPLASPELATAGGNAMYS